MPKKFLLVASYPESLLNFRGHLLRELIAVGLEVHVAAPNLPMNSTVRKKLENLGIFVHQISLQRTGNNPFLDLLLFFSLWRLMIEIKPKYFLAYTIKPVIYGSIAAWLAMVPKRFALITGIGYAFEINGEKRTKVQVIAQNLYRVALYNAHVVFFQNPDDQALFEKLGLVNEKRQKTVIVNGSGIDIHSFEVSDIPKHVHFLMIARLLKSKGVKEYAEAASIVRSKYPNVNFNLAGWLDESPDAFSQLDLQDWIRSGTLVYHGYLHDVRLTIAASSVFVLPSYREGTPRTVLEAMSMGRPIVTTDAPGCRETVVDGYNGFLVATKSVHELVSAMLKFIEQPNLITLMGERSRQIVEEKYDVTCVNAQMLSEMEIK